MGFTGPHPAQSRSRGAGWAAATLVGIAGWLGVTVFVAATNPDPSDATPILRTFAIAGGVFFGVVFGAAALQLRRGTGTLHARIYRRLATTAVPASAVRAAVRGGRRAGHVYLLFGGVTTALMLTTIGLGEDGPYEWLLGVAFLLVLAWAGYAVVVLRGSYRGSGDLMAGLGLSITQTPGWSAAGRLVGELRVEGARHGRPVTVRQTAGEAVTTVTGELPRRTTITAAAMASATGLPAATWRGVTARTGPDGVVVHRRRNGAGRWLLPDLLLAERLADLAH